MKSLFPVRVGELTYTNTMPFRLCGEWPLVSCFSPRLMARWCQEGRVDAGPLPVVGSWSLSDDFEPLGPFGIAVEKEARSVLLFSKRDWRELAGKEIGVTDQTSTSAKLLSVLTRGVAGFSPLVRPGFHADDTARLYIGDQALTPSIALREDFPYVMDLGEEWFRWTKKPFVFAHWYVRKTVPSSWRERLQDSLRAALSQFHANHENYCRQTARFLKMPTKAVATYFDGFRYEFTQEETESETFFRALAEPLMERS